MTADLNTDYNLALPSQKVNMPDGLLEISGICFKNNDYSTLYAEQDEKGKIFRIKLSDNKVSTVKFDKDGDYEDIAILGNVLFMLRSDGHIYSFDLDKVDSKSSVDIKKKFTDVLPDAEYEGMYADPATNKVYVLTKKASGDDNTHYKALYVLDYSNNALTLSRTIQINTSPIAQKLGATHIDFHPSAISRNPYDNKFYILSSVNGCLATLSNNFEVDKVYTLDPDILLQPEGLAFDNAGNMYISSEGKKKTDGYYLKFNRH